MAYYYHVKALYPTVDKGKLYKYDDFYKKSSDYSTQLVYGFKRFFLEPTVNLIYDITKTVNSLDDWFRGKRTQDYIKAITDKLQSNSDYKENYKKDYVDRFKVTKV